jgi:heat shock protein HslJ
MKRHTLCAMAAMAVSGAGALSGCMPTSGAAPKAPLATIPLDTHWRLTALRGAVPLEGHVPTLSWEADGRIHGQASCNRYFGEWSGTPQQLQLKSVGMTKMACFPDSVGQQETAFVQTLAQVRRLRMDGAQLVLEDNGGQALLRFARAQTD